MGFLEVVPGFAIITIAFGVMGYGMDLSQRLLNNGKMRRTTATAFDRFMMQRDVAITGAMNVQQDPTGLRR